MEKINVAELLKDCPKGMELDCTIYEDVVFHDIVDRHYPIRVRRKQGGLINLNAYGCMDDKIDSKCVIFPKGKTTWEGFQRHFKDGDIVFTRTGDLTWVSIFKQFGRDVCRTYIDLCIDDNDWVIDTRCLCSIEEIDTQRLATEEEKQKLFQAIKDNGYKWNAETKTLEKLVEQKFKIGDRVKSIINQYEYTIADIRKDVYIMYYATDKFGYHVPFCDEDKFDLVPDKFNIATLVPFESKVLVRGADGDLWKPAIYGFLHSKGCYVVGGIYWRQCIPYEANKELLGTTNDCHEYFKTWDYDN